MVLQLCTNPHTHLRMIISYLALVQVNEGLYYSKRAVGFAGPLSIKIG
jgi:hypothetical protein